MLFSRSTEYAIRAMTFLATLPPGRLAGAKEISEAEKIPMAFLWKILQLLARRKLIRSFKGLRGGYELAQPPGMLTLDKIIEVTDGSGRLDGCILGLPNCSDANACPLHESWKELRANMSGMLHQNTLADLAEVAKRRTKVHMA
jgi:Rrf2 family transcriptional regulator, iron-sulfur cluster assembly transcription factor